MAQVEERTPGLEGRGIVGQHKFNPVAIAAKNGELPPKKPNQTKREREAELNKIIWQVLFEKGLAEPFMMAKAIGDIPHNRIESARGRSKTDGDLETELEEFVRWKGE